MENMYGQEFVNDESGYLTAGENAGFSLQNFTLTQVDWGNYQGDVIEVQFGKDTLNVRRSVLPIEKAIEDAVERNSKKAKPISEDGAKKQAATEWNLWMRLVISPFCGEEAYNTAMAKAQPKTIKEFYEVCKSLLPEDYPTKVGRVLLTWKSNGYLELPKFAWMLDRRNNPDNTFFTLDDTQKLTVTKYFNLEKPVVANREEGSATTPVVGEDLPF